MARRPVNSKSKAHHDKEGVDKNDKTNNHADNDENDTDVDAYTDQVESIYRVSKIAKANDIPLGLLWVDGQYGMLDAAAKKHDPKAFTLSREAGREARRRFTIQYDKPNRSKPSGEKNLKAGEASGEEPNDNAQSPANNAQDSGMPIDPTLTEETVANAVETFKPVQKSEQPIAEPSTKSITTSPAKSVVEPTTESAANLPAKSSSAKPTEELSAKPSAVHSPNPHVKPLLSVGLESATRFSNSSVDKCASEAAVLPTTQTANQSAASLLVNDQSDRINVLSDDDSNSHDKDTIDLAALLAKITAQLSDNKAMLTDDVLHKLGQLITTHSPTQSDQDTACVPTASSGNHLIDPLWLQGSSKTKRADGRGSAPKGFRTPLAKIFVPVHHANPPHWSLVVVSTLADPLHFNLEHWDSVEQGQRKRSRRVEELLEKRCTGSSGAVEIQDSQQKACSSSLHHQSNICQMTAYGHLGLSLTFSASTQLTCGEQKCPQQTDKTNCGILMLSFLQVLWRGGKMPADFDTLAKRKEFLDLAQAHMASKHVEPPIEELLHVPETTTANPSSGGITQAASTVQTDQTAENLHPDIPDTEDPVGRVTQANGSCRNDEPDGDLASDSDISDMSDGATDQSSHDEDDGGGDDEPPRPTAGNVGSLAARVRTLVTQQQDMQQSSETQKASNKRRATFPSPPPHRPSKIQHQPPGPAIIGDNDLRAVMLDPKLTSEALQRDRESLKHRQLEMDGLERQRQELETEELRLTRVVQRDTDAAWFEEVCLRQPMRMLVNKARQSHQGNGPGDPGTHCDKLPKNYQSSSAPRMLTLLVHLSFPHGFLLKRFRQAVSRYLLTTARFFSQSPRHRFRAEWPRCKLHEQVSC